MFDCCDDYDQICFLSQPSSVVEAHLEPVLVLCLRVVVESASD